MQLNLRNLLLNSTVLKMSSFIIACMLWSLLNKSFRAHLTLAIPVCYYNLPTTGTLTSPEQVTITLAGTPSSIRSLDPENLAAHIDAQTIHEGTQTIELDTQKLLLPAEVGLVNYSPIDVTLSRAE